jgi:hypothetical protein
MYGSRISHRHDDDCPDIAGTDLSQTGSASAMASMRRGRIPIITMSTIFAGCGLLPGGMTAKKPISRAFAEPAFGLEPKTFSLQVKCSTN